MITSPLNHVSQKKAFTLIELLVVVAIIALLVALLVPAMEGARRQAKVVSCNANLHHLGVGLNVWISYHEGKYPPCPQSHVSGGQQLYCPDYKIYGFDDHIAYMTEFLDVVAGRTEIFFCPLDETWRPLLQNPAWTDPEVGPYVLDVTNADGPSYNMGYLRFAGAEPLPGFPPETVGWPMTADFTNSGNADPTKGPMEPGLAQDAILCDMVGSDVNYADVHADVYLDAPETHRENNVAFGDGHAETHYHTPSLQDWFGYWYWEEHYVKRQMMYLLY